MQTLHKALLGYTGWSTAELARQLKMSRMTIWGWDNNKYKMSLESEAKVYNLFPSDCKYKSMICKHLKRFGKIKSGLANKKDSSV